MRTILKWIFVAILAVLVIFLIIKVATRPVKKNNTEPQINYVEKQEDKEKDKEKTDATLTNTLVDVADTGTTRGVGVGIGLVLIGGTFLFITKQRKVEE